VSAPSSEVLARIDDLQARYIRALDDKRMDDWLACFSARPDSSYILNTAENEDRKRPLALILDDCRGRLEDRVSFVTRIWRGTYQDYRTRHFVQRTGCNADASAGLEVVTNFTVLFTPEDTGRTEVFAAGVYIDRVVPVDGGLVFLSKKAVIDSSLMARYLVYPL
jgi:3-phenylpropionate/cinnamic acid dioxygenase small subunit